MAEPLVDASPPIRVAVLTTAGGPRLRYLLEVDPNRGERYDVVVGAVNDTDGEADALLASHGVPVERRDIHAFYDERDAEITDMDVRRSFDTELAETVADYDPDLVVLSGYLHILTRPFLERFGPAILNAHHGDLTIRDESGTPVYTGLSAVEDAIRGGEASTCETVHVATRTVDTGPLVARSRPYPVHRRLVDDALADGDDETVDAYVAAHRRWMIRTAGGPTLATAIELVADGRVAWQDCETYVDGHQGYYQAGTGVQSATPPRIGNHD